MEVNAIQIALDITELVEILGLYLSTIEATEFCLLVNRPLPKVLILRLLSNAKELKLLCNNKFHRGSLECYYCEKRYCSDCICVCKNCNSKKLNIGICTGCEIKYPSNCGQCRHYYCLGCLQKCHAYKYCDGYICDTCTSSCSKCHQISCCIWEDGICQKCKN
jgi:hypothetical protein